MVKEFCFRLSRRLWGGSKYKLPQKRLRGRLYLIQILTNRDDEDAQNAFIFFPSRFILKTNPLKTSKR